MEEKLIIFSTAKLAKEKGFDEKCEFQYDIFEEGNKHNGRLRDFNHAYSTGKPMDKNSNCLNSATAPTQSFLQRWLRNNHNIDIWIVPFISKEPKQFEGFYWNRGDVINVGKHSSYEKALEAVLFETLKLIRN